MLGLKKFVLLSVILFCLKSSVDCEVFSAIDQLEYLAINEFFLIKAVTKFAESLNITTLYLDNKLQRWRDEHALARNQIKRYIANPLNAYLLIKRATADIEVLAQFMQVDYKELKFHLGHLVLGDDDLRGAVEGLLRLQRIYDLKSDDFAVGRIDGESTRDPLTAHDLFVIGREAFKMQRYEYFVFEYLKLALGKISQRGDKYGEVDMTQITIMVSETFYRTGDFKGAIMTIETILEKDKTNKGAIERRQKYIEAHEGLGSRDAVFDDPYDYDFKLDGQYSRVKEEKLFSKACRGLLKKKVNETSKLHCKYVSKSPFSLIAPFKAEEFNLDPVLVVFYDIISTKEIETLKNLAKPKLERGTILGTDSKSVIENTRVVKTAFIWDDEHKIVEDITKRVNDMTGLEMSTAEPIQVQNYGIGGHFRLHWDQRMKYEKPFELGTGNRIATVLFYLTDVKKGGHTVFPYVKVRVPPKKGSAVFWYDLKKSGDSEFYMKHGSCPVLIGSKWVANKWIHEFGQEFIRPCDPDETDEFTEDDFHDIFF